MRPWEDFEYTSEFDWNMARKTPRQRRSGLIALGLLVLSLFGIVALVKSL